MVIWLIPESYQVFRNSHRKSSIVVSDHKLRPLERQDIHLDIMLNTLNNEQRNESSSNRSTIYQMEFLALCIYYWFIWFKSL